MKRLFTLLLAMVMTVGICSASSSVIVAPAPTVAPAVTATAPAPLKATEINIPLGNTGKTVNLQELSTMKMAELEKLTGKKLGLLQRLEVKLAQRKLRHSINADGTIRNKKLAMLTSREFDGDEGLHIGGFALGFFLFLIGVLIAYLINDEKQRNRVKWAWIGAGVILLIFILLHL